MAKVFKAKKTIFIPATSGSNAHPELTEYRVAWGTEQWTQPTDVTKIQMVYKGTVAGMLSPSYPDNTNDLKAVLTAIKFLPTVEENTHYVCTLREVDDSFSIDEVEDEVDNWVTDVFAAKRKPQYIMTTIEVDQEIEVEPGLKAFLFKVQIFSSM